MNSEDAGIVELSKRLPQTAHNDRGIPPCSAQRARCSSNTASTAESANVPVIRPCIAERCDWIRAFSSAVAARVKVMMSILLTETSSSATKRSTRCLMEKVFPCRQRLRARSDASAAHEACQMTNRPMSLPQAPHPRLMRNPFHRLLSTLPSAHRPRRSQPPHKAASSPFLPSGVQPVSLRRALYPFAIVVLTAIPHQSAFLEQRSRARQGLRPYKGLRAPSLSVRRKPQPALGLSLARR